tara:strand:+ start:362 stop:490 length:129 start_codon:yes stop_codon:yes gene_type:complete
MHLGAFLIAPGIEPAQASYIAQKMSKQDAVNAIYSAALLRTV